MPRIMHVAKAGQRYEMVPLTDESGEQVTTTQHRNRPTKRGKTDITRKRTVADKSKPLPPRDCEYCRKPIEIGTPFQYVSIKRTYGGTTRYRHESCPSWQPWDLSSAVWAMVARVQHEAAVDGSSWESMEDAESARDEAAQAAGEVRDEKQESLDNMPDGLRDASELNDTVAALDDWVSEIENVTLPDFPEGKCENCGGEQMECSVHEEEKHSDDPAADNYCDGTEECMECNGSGDGEVVDPDELQAWRDEAQDAIQQALDSYQG